MSVIVTEEILFPAYKVSSTSWSDDDATHILRTTSGSPSCISTGLEWLEDEGDDDEIRFRLDSPDSYAFNFTEFEIHAFICSTDLGTETLFQLKIGSETFSLNTQNNVESEWFEGSYESVTTYSASELNFAQLWITADGRNHRDTKIPTVYIVARGFYDVDQWDPDGAVELGGCAGARHHKVFGGLEITGEAWYSNPNMRFPTGGVRVGELQPRYPIGGIEIEGEATGGYGLWGDGGAVAGGAATLSVITATRGGVLVGPMTFDNGFLYRIPITIPAAEEILLGVIVGFPVYLPLSWNTFTVEDSEGRELAFEIVSRQGLKLSLFCKVNVGTEEQIIYLYGGA